MTSDAVLANADKVAAPIAKQPAHQQVYEQLRRKILFGDLAPGQAITIQGLTEEMNAGMTPVREALRRLIAQGALTHKGNRRVSVPELDANGVEELEFMRKTLEPELGRRAVTRLTQDDIKALSACDTDLNNAIDSGDVGGYLTHNYRFHKLIYDSAAAPIMAATVDRLWLRFGPSLRVVCGRFGTSNLPDMHHVLLEALARRDADAAADAIAGDVAQGMKQVRTALVDQDISVPID